MSCSVPSSLAVVSPQEPLSFNIDIAGGVDAQTRRPALLSLSICAHTAAVPPSAVQRHREEAAKGSAAAADGEKPVIALTLCTSSALYGQCVYILFLDLVISLRYCFFQFCVLRIFLLFSSGTLGRRKVGGVSKSGSRITHCLALNESYCMSVTNHLGRFFSMHFRIEAFMRTLQVNL